MFHGWLPGYSPLPRVAGQVSKKTRGDGLALSTALLPQDGLTETLNIFLFACQEEVKALQETAYLALEGHNRDVARERLRHVIATQLCRLQGEK